jgi:alpha-galactosidase
MGIECPLASEFDDECFFMRHGKRVIDHGRYQFDFSNPKVREYATSVVDRVVGEYGAGYIKFDYNIDAGVGTEVGSDSFGDGLLRHNRAYLEWIDSIRTKYPELILEDCSSGGLRADYAMLAHHHILSVTDQEDYRYTGYIAAAAPTMALPEQTAIWACPKADADVEQVTFNMTSALLQRIHLSGKIAELDEDKFALVKEAIRCYKDIRDEIPTGKPFYPLGLPKFGDDVACVAFRYEDCIRMCVWCYKDGMSITLSVWGKEAKILYPSSSDAGIRMLNNGLELSFSKANTSVVIELK